MVNIYLEFGNVLNCNMIFGSQKILLEKLTDVVLYIVYLYFHLQNSKFLFEWVIQEVKK